MIICLSFFIDILWVSSIFFHTPQRYNRDVFIKILKAEILLQVQQRDNKSINNINNITSNSPLLLTNGESSNSNNKGSNSNYHDIVISDQMIRLNISKKKYLDKKRYFYESEINTGMSMKGSKILIYDESNNKWRINVVLDCLVKWIELGTVVYITHLLQVNCMISL